MLTGAHICATWAGLRGTAVWYVQGKGQEGRNWKCDGEDVCQCDLREPAEHLHGNHKQWSWRRARWPDISEEMVLRKDNPLRGVFRALPVQPIRVGNHGEDVLRGRQRLK